MAAVAMFVFSSAANAQLGKLLRKGANTAASAATTAAASSNKSDKSASAQGGQMVELLNWKTGQKEQFVNLFSSNPITAEKLYQDEKNFHDKELKAKIIEQFMDDEKFNNRKRSADDPMKDRKVVEILFGCERAGVVAEQYREIEMYVISELTNGATIAQYYAARDKYVGWGEYEGNFAPFWLNKLRPWHYMIIDWKHDENAKPGQN